MKKSHVTTGSSGPGTGGIAASPGRGRAVRRLIYAGLAVASVGCSPSPEAWPEDGVVASLQRADLGGGVSLSYMERGTGEPLVLVHGSLADLSYWQQSQQVALLSDRYRVIAYSRRYNYPNANVPTGNHSPLVEAADLARLLKVLETGPIHLVGHSYGAYTALVFAMEHPTQLRSLVLAEPPLISWLPEIPGGAGIFEGFMAEVWDPLAEAFRSGGDEGGLDFTARWYFRQPLEDVEPAWQTLFRNNVAEWRALAFSTATFPKLDVERVRALSVPTLLLSGGNNAGGFNDLIDAHLEYLIRGAERVTIPDASHEMFLDAPRVTADLMLQHFARQRTVH